MKMAPLRSIQALRGIAALAVVVCHAATTHHGIVFPGVTGRNLGEWGVDVFFVISGFIMTLITASHRGEFEDTQRFWIRRIFRIVPMYWLVSAAVLICALGSFGTDYKPTVDHVIASLLFIPWTDARGVTEPVLRVGWTLNFEMYFYLMFGLLLLVPLTVLWLTVWVFSALLLGALWHPISPLGQMLTSPLLLEFLMGVYIGTAFQKGWRLPYAVILAPVALTAIVAFDVSGFRSIRVIEFGIPAVVLVASAVSLEVSKTLSFTRSLPLLLGDWSYSIYLTHVLTLAMFGTVIEATHMDGLLPGPIMFLAEIAMAVCVGALAYQMFERPLQRYRNWRWTHGSLPAGHDAA